MMNRNPNKRSPQNRQSYKKDNHWKELNETWQRLESIALNINSLDANGYNNFCELVKNYVNNLVFKGSGGSKNVTTSKIRNIHSILKKMKDPNEVVRLRPPLAYLAGRDKKTKFFMDHLDRLVKRIENENQLESFQQFLEAIICYAKEND